MEELKKRGKKLAIVSGNITNHIKLILELQGMEGLFDAIVGSDQLNKPKPEPDGILLACKKLGVEANAKNMNDLKLQKAWSSPATSSTSA